MPGPTPAPETPTIAPEISTPLAIEILGYLFRIQERLPAPGELDDLRTTIAEQGRAIAALRTEVSQLRYELAEERKTRHTALALHLADPGRERERAVGTGPRA